MANLLAALKGVRLIARGKDHGKIVEHWLLPSGQVLEVVYS